MMAALHTFDATSYRAHASQCALRLSGSHVGPRQMAFHLPLFFMAFLSLHGVSVAPLLMISCETTHVVLHPLLAGRLLWA